MCIFAGGGPRAPAGPLQFGSYTPGADDEVRQPLSLVVSIVVLIHLVGGSVLQGWKHSISQITKHLHVVGPAGSTCAGGAAAKDRGQCNSKWRQQHCAAVPGATDTPAAAPEPAAGCARRPGAWQCHVSRPAPTRQRRPPGSRAPAACATAAHGPEPAAAWRPGDAAPGVGAGCLAASAGAAGQWRRPLPQGQPGRAAAPPERADADVPDHAVRQHGAAARPAAAGDVAAVLLHTRCSLPEDVFVGHCYIVGMHHQKDVGTVSSGRA